MDGAGSSTNLPISQIILFAALKLIFNFPLELKIAELSKKNLKISSKFDFLRRSWSQNYSFVSNPHETKKIALNEIYLHKKSGPRSFVCSKVIAVLVVGKIY